MDRWCGIDHICFDKSKNTLECEDEFAQKNKLEWGEAKCQVMRLGKKVATPNEWKLGEKKISNTSYRYLGDTIINDGKNKRNLEIRENKVTATKRQINSTASSDIMRGVKSWVLLILYKKSILPSFIYNRESWILTPSKEKYVNQIGIRELKRLFGLPTTTPKTAVIYSLRQLYMIQEIDKKRLMYLHRITCRDQNHLTNKMLTHLKTCNIGWAMNMFEKLSKHDIDTNWKKAVYTA